MVVQNPRMELATSIKKIFEHYGPYHMGEAIRDSENLLLRDCARNAVYDVASEDEAKKWTGIYGFQQFNDILLSLGRFGVAENLLLRQWLDLGDYQVQSHRRIYRAWVAINLCKTYLYKSDRGAALRWALLTAADDLFDDNDKGEGANQLHGTFGMAHNHFELLKQISFQCRATIQDTYQNDWSQPEGFAEEIVRQLAEDESMVNLFGENADIREFPITPAYLQSLVRRSTKLSRESKDNKDNPQKGNLYESIAFYLCLLLPSCVPLKNVLDLDKVGEYDLLVRNFRQTSSLMSEILGRHFLVECKNLADKTVNAAQVGFFLYKMHLTDSKFGIIFATNNVSGSNDGKAADELIDRARLKDNKICIVITQEDLEALANGGNSFWWLIYKKIEESRYGRKRSPKKRSASS